MGLKRGNIFFHEESLKSIQGIVRCLSSKVKVLVKVPWVLEVRLYEHTGQRCGQPEIRGEETETIPGMFYGLRKRQFFTTVMLVRKISEVPSLHLNAKSSIENSH